MLPLGSVVEARLLFWFVIPGTSSGNSCRWCPEGRGRFGLDFLDLAIEVVEDVIRCKRGRRIDARRSDDDHVAIAVKLVAGSQRVASARGVGQDFRNLAVALVVGVLRRVGRVKG